MFQWSISSAIEETIKEFDESPKDICNGNCYRFAKAVVEKLGGDSPTVNIRSVVQMGSQSHTWIESDGIYYDAESPFGVDNRNDLKFFGRNPEVA